MRDSDALPTALAGPQSRRRLTSVTFRVATHDETVDPVRYRWDADTEILSASIVDRRGGGSVATTVELEGSDGSWVTLELRAGRLCGMEVAVWPPVKARSVLTPPPAPQCGHATLPPALVGSVLSDVEVDTMLAAESDRLERTFHLRVGAPRRSRAVRVGRDILLELDDADQLAGLWLLNVPRSSAFVITTIVLIKADPKSLTQAATRIAGFDGVQEVYSVSGEWDLVAVVRVAEYEQIADVVTHQIAGVVGIVRTMTLTAFRAYSKKDLEQAWDIGVE